MSKRLVIVDWDYLDGMQGVSYRDDLHEWEATGRLVDEDLIAAFDAALAAAKVAEDALWKAWSDAPDAPNPKYVPDEPEAES